MAYDYKTPQNLNWFSAHPPVVGQPLSSTSDHEKHGVSARHQQSPKVTTIRADQSIRGRSDARQICRGHTML